MSIFRAAVLGFVVAVEDAMLGVTDIDLRRVEADGIVALFERSRNCETQIVSGSLWGAGLFAGGALRVAKTRPPRLPFDDGILCVFIYLRSCLFHGFFIVEIQNGR